MNNETTRPEGGSVIVIAVSTGGPAALEVLLPMLPATLAAPVLIAQHMPPQFTQALAERLRRLCALPVAQAHAGQPLRAGTILLAPGDEHMEISDAKPHGRTVRLHRGPALNGCVPSADYLFRSAARIYGRGAVAVVLTGMGTDGLEGARAVHQAGGSVLAQDAASSAVWGMPARIVEAGLAHLVAPLTQLAPWLLKRVGMVEAARPVANVAPGRVVEVPNAGF